MTRTARALIGCVAALSGGAVALAFGLAALPHAAAATADASPGANTIRIEDGRLSVRLSDIPLATVLERIGREAGIEVRIVGDLGAARPEQFDELRLDEGIRRLVGDAHSLVILFAPGPSGSRTSVPRAIQVRSAAGGSAVAIAYKPNLRDAAALGDTPEDGPPRILEIRKLAGRADAAAVQRVAGYLADDPDAEVRRMSAGALASMRGEEAAAALEHALDDQDPAVRRQALRSLRMLRSEEAVAVLGRVAREDADPDVRRTAILLLGSLESLDVDPTLEAASSDPAAEVRAAAARVRDRR